VPNPLKQITTRRVERTVKDRIVPVPLADVLEKRDEAAIGQNLFADRSNQDAAGQDAHQAHHQRILADGGLVSFSSKQAGLLQCGQIEV